MKISVSSTLRLLPTLTVRTNHTSSQLPNHVHAFQSPSNPSHRILSLLKTDPPNSKLSLGSTTSIPVTPETFTANKAFIPILQAVLRKEAVNDPYVQSSAAAYASEAGFVSQGRGGRATTGAGPTSSQGGVGSAGRGGFVHVSDMRKLPDWGRIADPEDILGSVEVDGRGNFVDQSGNYQESFTYRLVTGDGIMQLSPYLLEKVTERLKELEKDN
jgi:hypothetical protein